MIFVYEGVQFSVDKVEDWIQQNYLILSEVCEQFQPINLVIKDSALPKITDQFVYQLSTFLSAEWLAKVWDLESFDELNEAEIQSPENSSKLRKTAYKLTVINWRKIVFDALKYGKICLVKDKNIWSWKSAEHVINSDPNETLFELTDEGAPVKLDLNNHALINVQSTDRGLGSYSAFQFYWLIKHHLELSLSVQNSFILNTVLSDHGHEFAMLVCGCYLATSRPILLMDKIVDVLVVDHEKKQK